MTAVSAWRNAASVPSCLVVKPVLTTLLLRKLPAPKIQEDTVIAGLSLRHTGAAPFNCGVNFEDPVISPVIFTAVMLY